MKKFKIKVYTKSTEGDEIEWYMGRKEKYSIKELLEILPYALKEHDRVAITSI